MSRARARMLLAGRSEPLPAVFAKRIASAFAVIAAAIAAAYRFHRIFLMPLPLSVQFRAPMRTRTALSSTLRRRMARRARFLTVAMAAAVLVWGLVATKLTGAAAGPPALRVVARQPLNVAGGGGRAPPPRPPPR